VLVSGAGALHLPHTPDLPGIESFEGTAFHSARWRHDHDLTDRAVAVIGTGASAIQFVPEIQPRVARLSLYQRSAAWVTPKPDRPVPAKEQQLYEKHPGAQRLVRNLVYWVMEARGAGTGFEVSATVQHMNITGRDGVALTDVWSGRGIGAHLGITVAGFPNFFLLLGPNTGLGHNAVVFMIESQIRYVLQALDLLDARGAAYVDVRPEAEADFLARTQRRLADTVWASGCKSWYLDEHGRNFTIWPHFTWQYWLATRRFRPADYTIRPSCQGATRSTVSTTR